eukprot:6208575-Pleurochrysis_carterae.AAC.2
MLPNFLCLIFQREVPALRIFSSCFRAQRRSTTNSRSVALDYAARQPDKLAILLVIQQGMVDRGGV